MECLGTSFPRCTATPLWNGLEECPASCHHIWRSASWEMVESTHLLATFVGFVYGFATIVSSSLVVPMASHALNNLAGGLLWRLTSKPAK
uniref:CAAX prenyl protease 2/Lysostaphin resistance protein A-like domain-containing protein n=1 Tax=Salix viminalis TaxID=40686 RepID=A0A6N2MNI1_SALVM